MATQTLNTSRFVDMMKNQYDPSVVSKVSSTSTAIRVGETEANILAKLYDFLVDSRQESKMEDKKQSQKQQTVVGSTATPSATKTKSGNLFNSGMMTGLSILGIVAVGTGVYMFSDEIQQKIQELEDVFSTSEIGKAFDKIKSMFDFSDILSKIGIGGSYGGGDVGYDADEEGAKKAAEQYLGRGISGKEWDELLRATHAEAGAKTNVKEEGMVFATILNRAREEGGEDSITKVLNKQGQFQAVTGTKQAPGPSEQYRTGPQGQRKESLFYAAKNVLPAVSRQQTQFTAASTSAYGAGTSTGYRDKMLADGGTVVGGSVFNTSGPAQSEKTVESASGKGPLDYAKSFLGFNESSNPQQLNSFIGSNFQSWDVQKQPWCAAFANSVLHATGYQGTGSGSASSFLNMPGVVYDARTGQGDLNACQPGDVAVFSRQGGAHVAFVQNISSSGMTVIGGNQSDRSSGGAVTQSQRGFSELLGIRRPGVSGVLGSPKASVVTQTPVPLPIQQKKSIKQPKQIVYVNQSETNVNMQTNITTPQSQDLSPQEVASGLLHLSFNR